MLLICSLFFLTIVICKFLGFVVSKKNLILDGKCLDYDMEILDSCFAHLNYCEVLILALDSWYSSSFLIGN